ncbi:MAG: hypothetical protein HY660_09335, partial [Armatimonadetes bacterium]|nr:hypothetical protein [Armatimonadota bacterium]
GVILPEDTQSGDFLLFYRDEVEPITSELTAAGAGSASTTDAALSA